MSVVNKVMLAFLSIVAATFIVMSFSGYSKSYPDVKDLIVQDLIDNVDWNESVTNQQKKDFSECFADIVANLAHSYGCNYDPSGDTIDKQITDCFSTHDDAGMVMFIGSQVCAEAAMKK